MPLAAAAPMLIPAAIKGGTALWGGLQARNAQNDAVSALLKSFGQAGDTATTAVDKVNPQILGAADKWGGAVMDAGSAAADSATAAADKGIAGVNDAIAGVNGAVSAGQGQMQPYSAAGRSALDTLSKLLNKPQSYQYQADPGYQFRLAEGQKQITRMAAAHGAAGGGGTAKALAQYNSGLASQEYNTGWNRWNTEKQARQGGLTTLAGMGERAGEFSGDLGMRGAAFGLQGQQFNAGLGDGRRGIRRKHEDRQHAMGGLAEHQRRRQDVTELAQSRQLSGQFADQLWPDDRRGRYREVGHVVQAHTGARADRQ